MRFLVDGPQRASQIVGRCGVTKQALSQQIAHLEREGYIAVELDPDDKRARMVGLTDKGRRAQAHVEQLFARIESGWRERYGAERVALLREIVTEIAEQAPRGC